MEIVRYCTVCDDEFRPDITVCSDCGGPLILQEEGLRAKGQGVDGSIAPDGAWRTALDSTPVSALLPVRTFDSLNDLEPAVAAFADVELPSRVLVQNGRYILLISPDALAAAQATLHAAQADVDDAPHPTFDAAAGHYSKCPACDVRLEENFNGPCPECGLELSAPGGSVVVPEAE